MHICMTCMHVHVSYVYACVPTNVCVIVLMIVLYVCVLCVNLKFIVQTALGPHAVSCMEVPIFQRFQHVYVHMSM